METKSTFVWSDSTVKLNTVTGIYLYLSFIINPRNTELNLSLWINKTLKQSIFTEFFLVLLYNRTK